MGLTPFHYALIFSDKKSQLFAVLGKKYPELPENQRTAFGNIGIYDLLTLAVFKKVPYSVLEKMILRTDEGAKQLRRSNAQTVQYLFHLYSDPDYLEKVLSSKGSWRLYTTDGGFFYMASEGEIESHRPSEDNANEETIGLERLFGDSWFSEKARTDMEVLKKEFRELAKKYHPDVSTEVQAADIFKEISAEYDLLRWNEEDSSQ